MIRIILYLLITLGAAQSAMSYTFQFKNISKEDIELHFTLKGIFEPENSIVVKAGQTVEQSFDGPRSGLCIDLDTVKARTTKMMTVTTRTGRTYQSQASLLPPRRYERGTMQKFVDLSKIPLVRIVGNILCFDRTGDRAITLSFIDDPNLKFPVSWEDDG